MALTITYKDITAFKLTVRTNGLSEIKVPLMSAEALRCEALPFLKWVSLQVKNDYTMRGHYMANIKSITVSGGHEEKIYSKYTQEDFENAFAKWIEDNWTAVMFSDKRPTGYYVHKSNDVKVENFNLLELKEMFANGYEPVIIHPTFAEMSEQLHNNKTMKRINELLEKRKNLTANVFEEEELIELSKGLPKEELDKIDPEMLKYSNSKRLDGIDALLNKMNDIVDKHNNK